jgi:hypothetical protein
VAAREHRPTESRGSYLPRLPCRAKFISLCASITQPSGLFAQMWVNFLQGSVIFIQR